MGNFEVVDQDYFPIASLVTGNCLVGGREIPFGCKIDEGIEDPIGGISILGFASLWVAAVTELLEMILMLPLRLVVKKIQPSFSSVWIC